MPPAIEISTPLASAVTSPVPANPAPQKAVKTRKNTLVLVYPTTPEFTTQDIIKLNKTISLPVCFKDIKKQLKNGVIKVVRTEKVGKTKGTKSRVFSKV